MNTYVSLLIIFTIIITNGLIFGSLAYWKKKSKKLPHSQITKKNQDEHEAGTSRLSGTPMKNRRKCIRVPIEDEYCTVRFFDIGNPKLKSLTDKQINGYIRDISLSGIKMVSNFELPVRSDICVLVTFELQGVPLTVKGQIVRREDHLGEELVTYGLQFQSLNRQAQVELTKFINNNLSSTIGLAGGF